MWSSDQPLASGVRAKVCAHNQLPLVIHHVPFPFGLLQLSRVNWKSLFEDDELQNVRILGLYVKA